MPRNGSGVYSKPAGTTAVPNTTIESSKFNQVVDDIAQDLNFPRPISAGGTGSQTIDQALSTLGFSEFFKTLIDETSGSAVFSAMGATYADSSTVVIARMPNNFIIQAGLFTGGGINPEVIFPLAFPNMLIAPFATMLVSAASDVGYTISIGTRNNTSMQLFRRSMSNGGAVAGITEPFFWLALGR